MTAFCGKCKWLDEAMGRCEVRRPDGSHDSLRLRKEGDHLVRTSSCQRDDLQEPRAELAEERFAELVAELESIRSAIAKGNAKLAKLELRIKSSERALTELSSRKTRV